MKKTFFKAAAAAAVVAATVALSSVLAFATPTEDPSVAVEIGATYNLTTKGSILSKQDAKITQKSTDGRFITDGKIDSAGVNLKTGDSSGLKLLTPSDADGCKLVITDGGLKDYIISYGLSTENSDGAGTYTTDIIPANSVVTITPNTTSSTKISTIEVKTGKSSTAFYSISGTVKVDGEAKSDVTVVMTGSENVTNAKVTTGADGKYTFEHVGNIDVVDISIADTEEYFGGVLSNLTPESSDITDADFNLEGKIPVKEINEAVEVNLIDGLTASVDQEKIPNDKVIGEYFKVVGNTDSVYVVKRAPAEGGAVTGIELGKRGDGSLEFTTTKDFKVTIVCSSNGPSNTSDIKVGDFFTSVSTQDHSDFVIDKLTAGTYTISSTGGSNTGRGVRVYSVKFEDIAVEDNADGATDGAVAVIKGSDGTYYAVVIVSEAEAQANSALKVNAGGNSASIETVYNSVVIDDNTYTADKLGGKAGDYVSGIKLTINNSSSAAVNAAAIQAKINVDKVAVA